MKARSLAGRFIRLAMVPFLATAVGVAAAQGPPGDRGHDDHGQDHGQDHGNNGNHGNDNHGNQGNNFHFRDQDRNNFQSHYSKDVNRWRNKPQGRPQFRAGQRIPSNYHFQDVPQSYYRNAPPPPPGYRYGYYDGYVVAYDPTSRIIADVLDLVVAGSR